MAVFGAINENPCPWHLRAVRALLVWPLHMDEEVFLDAEEDITPRRTGRKRRSTAGSTAAVKKPKTKMTTRHSPKAAGTVTANAGATKAPRSVGPPAGAD